MPQKTILSPIDVAALISAMKIVFPTIEQVSALVSEKLDEKIKYIPTKEEFFSRMDKLSKEIQDARDELTLHTGSHDDLTDKNENLDSRLVVVEKKLNISSALS